jgi:TIR domain/Protein of unknown function (DUF4241)
MKVFLSWSGEKSKATAEALREWLPNVIQAIEPWMSAEDIDKGARWASDLASQLESIQFGVICLTSDCIVSPWILFEAGALSKTLDKAYVCPYLFDISPADLAGPLIQFNAAKADKDDTRRLINTINKACGDKSIPHDRVDKAFEVWWPRLGEKLENIRNAIPIRKAERAKRNEREILEETLELVREIRRGSTALAARRKVGYVGVDSGQVIITDPAHLHDFEANNFDGSKKSSTGRSRYGKKSKGFEYSYSGCCAATSTGGAGQLTGIRGVAVSTGMGDGAYPIYVEYENGMISSVTVQFLD